LNNFFLKKIIKKGILFKLKHVKVGEVVILGTKGKGMFDVYLKFPLARSNHMIDVRKNCSSNFCETQMNMEKECPQIHYEIRI